MATSQRKILLVYNADSGLVNAVFSSLHKAVSPQTYSCELCRTTYGMRGMLRSWKDYLNELPFPYEIRYRDEFRDRFDDAEEYRLPTIFLLDEERGKSVLLDAAGIRQAEDVESLIGMVNRELSPLL